MAADIRKMLNLCTGHVTKEVGDWLDEQGKKAAGTWRATGAGSEIHMAKHEYGWLVWVYADPPDEWTGPDTPDFVVECLVPIFAYAHKRGCEWINFDCDASADPELPVHKW